jgi:signal transduction histidine kinase
VIIYCIVSAFLNVLAGVILGISVLLKAPRRRESHLFAWFTAGFVAWSLFYILWQLAGSEQEALLFARLLTGAAIFIPLTYVHFVSRLTGRRVSWEILIGYSLAIGLAGLSFTPLLVREVAPAMMFPYWPQPGIAFWPYIVVFLYYTARSWIILFHGLQKATHWRRKQLGYVCFGTVAGWIGGLTNFLLWLNIPVPPVGNGLALIYIISVGYAMMRFRLVDINLFVIKGLLYLLVVAAVSLIFPVSAWAISTYVPDRIPELDKVAYYVGAFLVTLGLFVIAPRLTRKIDNFLEERAMGAMGSNKHQLREHVRSISTLSSLTQIFERTTFVVRDSLRVSRVEIYFRHEHDADYRQQAAALPRNPFVAEGRISEDDWLVQLARSSRRAVVVYEVERTDETEPQIQRLERLGVELAVPIHADQILYGLLLCGSRRANQLYSDLDISLLETVCFQIGLTIRARELERRNNQTEKLISLGTLAAGLAHELRNPLVSIRTFTELIGEQGNDPEFRKEFQGLVARDVDRISTIIDHVAAFANNAEAQMGPLQLNRIISDVYEIARAEFKESGVEFVAEEPQLPNINGNYSQLIQVFLNLFQNAIQALSATASPRITVSFLVRERPDRRHTVTVQVADNGAGIAPGVRARIFEPFVTTKDTGQITRHRGMGLGLAIVKRIVEGHSGTIEVSSNPNGGTIFSVEFPCEKLPPGSDWKRSRGRATEPAQLQLLNPFDSAR